MKTAADHIREHWPEYLIEACNLAAFMLSLSIFAVILEGKNSSVPSFIAHSSVRRALMGMAMGLTAIGIIYSPMGKRSGAHMNPSVTFTFFALGKIRAWDAFFYILFQFLGGAIGITLGYFAFGDELREAPIRAGVTEPGHLGIAAAGVSEFIMAFLMMLSVLILSNKTRLAPYTGMVAGGLVALFIFIAAPISGMSLNPARSTASALLANVWGHLWLYFLAPPAGMLLASKLYVRALGLAHVRCAKLDHRTTARCIFCCTHTTSNAPVDS